MNKELLKYLTFKGNEPISNKHLMFINDLLKKSNTDYGYLYKLSNKIYMSIKNKDNKTLNEIVKLIKK